MKAWVITEEHSTGITAAIGLLSARLSPPRVSEYLEWLYGLLHLGPNDQLAAARYRGPFVPYKSQDMMVNRKAICCGHNPCLIARLATNVSLLDPDAEIPRLQWTQPERIEINRETLRITDRIPGRTEQAPYHAPLKSPLTEKLAS